MIIRALKKGESGKLSEIAYQAKKHWGYKKEWMDKWRDDLTVKEEEIDSWLGLGVETEGRMIAFGMIRIEGEKGDLEHFWVLPEFMGIGVGKKLFNALIDQVKSRNLIRLEILSDPNAVGFYEKMGARVIGEEVTKIEGRKLPKMELVIAKL